MCDMAPESAINVSMSKFCFGFFLINTLSQITSYVTFLQIIFHLFYSCRNPSLWDWSFWNNFIPSCYLSSCCYLIFFFDSLATLFTDMSSFVTVIKFWHVCTFYIQEVLWLMTLLLASHKGTLVLGFYINEFFIFYWRSWYWLFVHSVKMYQKLVTDPLDS